MIERLESKFTKYEIARILGARSLQLAMDAPVLLKLTKEEEEKLNYDTLRIAEKELEAGVLPITVKRPFPKKSEKTVKKLSEEEIKEKIEQEVKEEKVSKGGDAVVGIEPDKTEMAEMASPEDEQEPDDTDDTVESDEEVA
jgi:DNA-directed RNA polymerase subunit K